MSAVFFFFFFQAEDGIRDYKVTGVQTCALPICPPYAYGDCDKVSIGVAMADCEVDNYSGKVGVGAIASWGPAAARAQVGTRGDFSYSGYHKIGRASCRERV